MCHLFRNSSLLFIKCLKDNLHFSPRVNQFVSVYHKNFYSSSKFPTRHKMDFLISDYKFVGFDFDNTICEYNLNEMVRMEYDVMSDWLVKKGYPKDRLKAEMDVDFLQRGLILDFERGNIIKLDRSGGIMKATHGSKCLTREVIDEIYGIANDGCPILNKIKNDLTEAYTPECMARYRIISDYFDMPGSLAFARCVDSVDDKGEHDFRQCGDDIISCIMYMFNRDNFANGASEYFKRLKGDPSKFIVRCDPRLITWLKELRKNKHLFLVTGSNCDLLEFVAEHSLGPGWQDLFDVIVSYSRKPHFFKQNNPFREIVDKKEGNTIEKLSHKGFYSQGNWADLQDTFRQAVGQPEARGLYFGDHMIQDVFTPCMYAGCDTVAIVEEMNENHQSSQILSSQFWGPMHAEGSWWGNVIKNYSKAFLHSINTLLR